MVHTLLGAEFMSKRAGQNKSQQLLIPYRFNFTRFTMYLQFINKIIHQTEKSVRSQRKS